MSNILNLRMTQFIRMHQHNFIRKEGMKPNWVMLKRNLVDRLYRELPGVFMDRIYGMELFEVDDDAARGIEVGFMPDGSTPPHSL